MFSAVLTAAFCLMPMAMPFDGRRRWLYLIPVAGLAFFSSRASLLSLFAAAWLGALVTRPRWRAGLLALAAAGCVAVYGFRDRAGADVSSRERLNRWECALRMASDRPWTGHGPGTYQFAYLPYQRPEAMTRISIVNPIEERGPGNYGRGGGAHSEYLQALSETGLPGLLVWTAFAVALLLSVFRQPVSAHNLYPGLALTTFLVHGLANNFLHDARMALVFWGIAATTHAAGASSRRLFRFFTRV
jgi:O-antigen ligase